MMSFDFDLELTVAKTACMHAIDIVATYVRTYICTSTRYLTRGQLARRHQPSASRHMQV